MSIALKPSDWPITIKVPLLVMALMLAVSSIVSNTVLSRLAETQERDLRMLSRAYLDGLSASLIPPILREDVWEVFDTLDRARTSYAGLHALITIVFNPSDRIIAASDPKAFATGQLIRPGLFNGLDPDGALLIDPESRTARLLNAVTAQGQHIGGIYAELDISALLKERQTVLWQLILTNTALTMFLMAIGYWAVRRMVQPVRTLDAYLDRSSNGRMEIMPDRELDAATEEFRRLFRRYNAMARAANERLHLAERLAEEERLASLGRLASGMAHEINNPLGGLFNALDALKRYGDRQQVRDFSIKLLERGLAGIRKAVQATLMTYRKPLERRPLNFEDIEDLRFLIGPALRDKVLLLDWSNLVEGEVAVPSAAVRDATLNLLLNACAASPKGATVFFSARQAAYALEISVGDHGSGLPETCRQFLEQSGSGDGPLQAGAGLGLWMVKRLLDEAGGTIQVETSAAGTTIRLTFPLAVEDVRHVA